MKIDILGVQIDNIGLDESLAKIEKWIWNPGKHYVVTPNLEFILAAQRDSEFKEILNKADLAIPDSSSLGLSYWLLKKSRLERVFLWPLFFLPKNLVMQFEVVPGTDLTDALCKLAAEKGFVTGFLGGEDLIAKKTAECLQKKYQNLKVAFAEAGSRVNYNGEEVFSMKYLVSGEKQESQNTKYKIPNIDILFVAFGHIKQEKWIAKNLDKIPVKLAMGVGGAFDYLSGSVPRAPKWIRNLGFEWLFRLIVQPWRIKRQLALIKYIFYILRAK